MIKFNRTTPYRHSRINNGTYVETSYTSDQLVSDKYDREVNRGLKYQRAEMRHGRLMSQKMYSADRVVLKQHEIDTKKYVDSQLRILADRRKAQS